MRRHLGGHRVSALQQRMLSANCSDLAAGLSWRGQRLTKYDWRHTVAGRILGWRLMPAIDRGRARLATSCWVDPV